MIDTKKPLDVITRFLLLGALFQRMDDSTETYREPQPPPSPYVGNAGQLPGESHTAWRIRVRKEQKG
jgi:hypothetical protein